MPTPTKDLRSAGYASLEKWLTNPNHVYIGRSNVYVPGAKQSIWANPFSVNKYGRDECLRLYKEYIMSNPDLLGKVLGCWCHPEPCHGHILCELANK